MKKVCSLSNWDPGRCFNNIFGGGETRKSEVEQMESY